MPKFLVSIDSVIRETVEIEAPHMMGALASAVGEVNRIRQGPTSPLSFLAPKQPKRTREVFFGETKVVKLDG